MASVLHILKRGVRSEVVDDVSSVWICTHGEHASARFAWLSILIDCENFPQQYHRSFTIAWFTDAVKRTHTQPIGSPNFVFQTALQCSPSAAGAVCASTSARASTTCYRQSWPACCRAHSALRPEHAYTLPARSTVAPVIGRELGPGPGPDRDPEELTCSSVSAFFSSTDESRLYGAQSIEPSPLAVCKWKFEFSALDCL